MDHHDFTDILDAVRTFIRHEVVPAEDVIEDTDDIPPHLKSQAAEMGLFGYALPEQYGGLGVTASEDVRLAFEFGYTAPAFRSMFGTNNGIAGQILVNFGTDDAAAEFLPRLASGESVASFALTEPEAGSDPSGLKTSRSTSRRGLCHQRPEALHHQCGPLGPAHGVRAGSAARRLRRRHLGVRRRHSHARRDGGAEGQEDGATRLDDVGGVLR